MGRVRTALDVEPLQTEVCHMAHEDSLRLCGRGACDYVQAPKAKGPGTARFDGFPTCRSRVCKGFLRGCATADVFTRKAGRGDRYGSVAISSVIPT